MSANQLPRLKGFGFSLASGVDVDGNTYNGREGLGRRDGNLNPFVFQILSLDHCLVKLLCCIGRYGFVTHCVCVCVCAYVWCVHMACTSEVEIRIGHWSVKFLTNA